MSKILAERLTKARITSGYTQNEIAELLGCGRVTITNYESGRRNPDIDTLVKLSQYYNVSADYLLGLSDAQTNDKGVQFICDYTGLSEKSVKYLNNSLTRTVHELLDFFLSDRGFNDYFELCAFFEDYKRTYKELMEHKENTIKKCSNLPIDDIEAGNIITISDSLNDRKDLFEFKIQKALINLIRQYCEEEVEKDMCIKADYQKWYEYLKYENGFSLSTDNPEIESVIDRLVMDIAKNLQEEAGDENANNSEA